MVKLGLHIEEKPQWWAPDNKQVLNNNWNKGLYFTLVQDSWRAQDLNVHCFDLKGEILLNLEENKWEKVVNLGPLARMGKADHFSFYVQVLEVFWIFLSTCDIIF